jgi:hypothetical protein
MAIYSSQLTFQEPKKEEVELTDELVKVIREHHKKSREHLFHLCIIAYGLRTHNLVKAKSGAGGNAQGRVYKPVFKSWYESNSLEDVYGSLSNFTLYAMAGRLLTYVYRRVAEKYIEPLPASMTALYALSQIVWEQGDKATDASRKLFEKALIEPIQDGSKKNAFIHPHISRKEIDAWRTKHTGKSASKKKVASVAVNDPRTIVIATVKVHEDLFNFAKVSGAKRVGPKLDDVVKLNEKIQSLIDEFNAGKSRFALDSQIEEVKIAYAKAEKPDFGKDILAEEKARTKTAKKQAAKRA